MQIEGIPDGWELVRIGTPLMGEFKLNFKGEAIKSFGCEKNANIPIIRKIEKAKRYRPFANAEEFKPHRNKWWRYKDKDPLSFRAPWSYDNSRYCNTTWQDCFNEMIFDDGTPFGVEVTE